MRAPLARQEAAKRQRRADDYRLVDQKQHKRAPDEGIDELRRFETQKRRPTQFDRDGRAERDEQTKQKRQREQRGADREKGAPGEPDGARKIKKNRRPRAAGGQQKEVFNRCRRAPQNSRRVAQRRERRHREKIHRRQYAFLAAVERRIVTRCKQIRAPAPPSAPAKMAWPRPFVASTTAPASRAQPRSIRSSLRPERSRSQVNCGHGVSLARPICGRTH